MHKTLRCSTKVRSNARPNRGPNTKKQRPYPRKLTNNIKSKQVRKFERC